MWNDQLASGGEEFKGLRDMLADTLHESHGGNPHHGCFLCKRSAGVMLESLHSNGFYVEQRPDMLVG